jgi:hypothetical protein
MTLPHLLSTHRKDARVCDFETIFGDLSQSEKLPEIKPPFVFFQKARCVFHIAKINIPNHYPDVEI